MLQLVQMRTVGIARVKTNVIIAILVTNWRMVDAWVCTDIFNGSDKIITVIYSDSLSRVHLRPEETSAASVSQHMLFPTKNYSLFPIQSMHFLSDCD